MPFVDTTPNMAAMAGPSGSQMLGVLGAGMGTGFQTANQIINSNDLMDQAKQQGQLGLDANQIALEQQMKNVSLQDLQRQLQTSQTKSDLDLQNTGLPAQAKQSQLQTQISSNEAAQQKTRVQKQLDMGQTAEEIDNVLQGQTSIPLDKIQIVRQKWEDTGFPPLPNDPTEARAMIASYANFNRNNADRLKALASQQSAERVAGIRGDASIQSAVERANAVMYTADQRVAAAKLRTDIEAARISGDPKTLDGVMARLQAKANAASQGSGPPLTDYEQGTLDSYKAALVLKARQSPGGAIASATEGKPSETEQKAASFPPAPTSKATTTQSTQSGYTAQQEAKISKVMSDPKNKGFSREEVIKALKDANKL